MSQLPGRLYATSDAEEAAQIATALALSEATAASQAAGPAASAPEPDSEVEGLSAGLGGLGLGSGPEPAPEQGAAAAAAPPAAVPGEWCYVVWRIPGHAHLIGLHTGGFRAWAGITQAAGEYSYARGWRLRKAPTLAAAQELYERERALLRVPAEPPVHNW